MANSKVGAYYLEPLYDKVVIRPEEKENLTAGGLVIPETASERVQRGHVVACGPGRLGDDNEIVPIQVEIGDYVIFAKYGGHEITFDDKDTLLVMAERDIHVILRRADDE